MNGPNKNLELLERAPVPKALLAMGLPTMLGMMINALYNLADAYFVGGLGTSQAGAIIVAYPLGQIVVGLGLLFGSGAASYLSRLLGQGEKRAADRVASTALYSSILVGASVIVCTILCLNPLLRSLGASESVPPYAVAYTRIYVISRLFNVFNVTMNHLVTSEGAAKTTMCALLAGAALNLVLDPVFIYGLRLGVVGAAIATAISQFVSTLVYLRYIRGKRGIFRFRIREVCFSKAILSEILKIGIPTMVFQLLTGLSIALINDRAKGYGDSVLVGLGDVTRIVSVGSLMVFGFIKGFQPIAGYSYGAKKPERLREATKTALLWSTLFCAAFGLVLALFPTELISQFTKGDPVLIQTGGRALRASGFTFPLFGFYTVYSSLFLALGRAKEGFFLGACRQGICFVPIVLLLPVFWGLRGIVYAQPISDVVSAAIAAAMALRLHRALFPAEKRGPSDTCV